MKKLILVALIAVAGWQGYTKYQARQLAMAEVQEEAPVSDYSPSPRVPADTPSPPTFQCDGRTYCSQMTSCEEATYFLRHCPGVKMDGDNDGIPCERQWCS